MKDPRMRTYWAELSFVWVVLHVQPRSCFPPKAWLTRPSPPGRFQQTLGGHTEWKLKMTREYLIRRVPPDPVIGCMAGQGGCFFLFLGIGFTILGILAVVLPVATGLAVEILVGSILILGGIIQCIRALWAWSWLGFMLRLLWSSLYLIAGVALLASPLRGLLTLALVLAVLFLVEGISKLALVSRLHPVRSRKWLFFDGAVAAMLGGLIWAGWPGDAQWVIGLLLGIRLLYLGWTTIMVALAVRNLS